MTCGRSTSSGARRVTRVTAALFVFALQTFGAEDAAASLPASLLGAVAPKHVDLRGERVPGDVRRIADWALDSGDHEGLPFVLIDKKRARVYVFSRGGVLLGSAPVLLGRALGDAFPAGVSELDMYETSPWQRITPAGRFRAEEFRKSRGNWILWVDYDSAIALHKVLLTNAAEERQARIDAADPNERRITYGCINVPIAFYDRVVHATFHASDGIVYVLPDTQPLAATFASYEVPGTVHIARADADYAIAALAGAAALVSSVTAPANAPREPRPSDGGGGMKLLPAQGRAVDEQGDEALDGSS